jgi:hypothetical protein
MYAIIRQIGFGAIRIICSYTFRKRDSFFCIQTKVIYKYLEVKDGKPNKYDC